MLILGISIVMLSSIFTAKIREYTVDDSDERLRKTCATVAQILVQPDADISKEHFGAAVWQAPFRVTVFMFYFSSTGIHTSK